MYCNCIWSFSDQDAISHVFSHETCTTGDCRSPWLQTQRKLSFFPVHYPFHPEHGLHDCHNVVGKLRVDHGSF